MGAGRRCLARPLASEHGTMRGKPQHCKCHVLLGNCAGEGDSVFQTYLYCEHAFFEILSMASRTMGSGLSECFQAQLTVPACAVGAVTEQYPMLRSCDFASERQAVRLTET